VSWWKRWGSAREWQPMRGKRQPFPRAGESRVEAPSIRLCSFSARS
jgi:hypothetical protein